jgi:hypothetical protein
MLPLSFISAAFSPSLSLSPVIFSVVIVATLPSVMFRAEGKGGVLAKAIVNSIVATITVMTYRSHISAIPGIYLKILLDMVFIRYISLI